jgi:phosphoglycerol transferase MdoB-like AlkP superfamily enzyme
MQSSGLEVLFFDYLQCAFYGLRLDISTASYFIAIPFLLQAINYFINKKILSRIQTIYHNLLIPVVITLLLANMPLYRSWGTLINRRAINFAIDPVEMLASLSTLMLISSIVAIGLLSIFFITVNKLMLNFSVKRDEKISIKIGSIIISLAILILGLRGGIQLIPINESAASFSSRSLLNDAATNPIWHLGNNISKTRLSDKNPYQEMQNDIAQRMVDSLHIKTECNVNLLNIKRPNVIILLLESFTADIIEPLGGEKGISPFITSLCDSSLLFTNIYASGRRTDQALPSVFGGFPAQPDYSVMRFTDKAAALPSMPRIMAQNGYHLSYFYGGETGFSNMGAYLHQNGFEKIVSKDDFAASSLNSKWGAHDEFLLQKQITDLSKEQQPFFSTLLTLTSHEPFEIPRADYFPVNNEPDRFRNAVRYTDDCLKKYFESAKQQPWYSNTIFILMADHGHLLPKQRDYYDVLSHKIPLIVFGEALTNEYKGKKMAITGGQHDLPATLLQQLNIPADDFYWSNNLTDTCRNGFTYIDLDQTLGWITDQGSFTYLHHSNKPERLNNITDTTLYIKSAAYRQLLFQTFLNLDESGSRKTGK